MQCFTQILPYLVLHCWFVFCCQASCCHQPVVTPCHRLCHSSPAVVGACLAVLPTPWYRKSHVLTEAICIHCQNSQATKVHVTHRWKQGHNSLLPALSDLEADSFGYRSAWVSCFSCICIACKLSTEVSVLSVQQLMLANEKLTLYQLSSMGFPSSCHSGKKPLWQFARYTTGCTAIFMDMTWLLFISLFSVAQLFEYQLEMRRKTSSPRKKSLKTLLMMRRKLLLIPLQR